jgi:hypothetical protein
MAVDLARHRRIKGIDRDRKTPQIQFMESFDGVGQQQAISAQALDQMRKLTAGQTKGLERLFIGQRVAGPGNAYHFNYLSDPFAPHHPANRIQRFLWSLDAACYPGSGLIDTIVPAGAVPALYVAAGRHRQMDPAVLPMVAAKAGVSLDILLSGAVLRHNHLSAENKKEAKE